MTETELERAKERLLTLRKTVRKDLAADLGGTPDDYDAENAFGTTGAGSDEAVPDASAGE